MPEDERQPVVGTQVSQPIPGKEAVDADDQILPRGRNRLEKWRWSRWHMALSQALSILVEEAEVHGPGMQVDATVELVRLGVEAHEVSSSVGR
jgi:hypothetical protein